jgi:arylsulfatase A-like enzyme
MTSMGLRPAGWRATAASLASFFAAGLLGGLAFGVIQGLLNIYDSAALPFGLSRLAIETLARDTGGGLVWGLIWGLVLTGYGFAFLKITGSGRRALVALAFTAAFWLMGAGLVALRLLSDLGTRLPLPYQDQVSPQVFLTRFVWPLISFTVTTRPHLVFALLALSILVPAGLAVATYFIARKKIGADPLGRLPSLAMTKKTGIVFLALVVAGMALAGAPKVLATPPDAPNVLFVSVDTLRADGLGCYGNQHGTSPVIDKLAANGVRYENFFSHAPWTLPGHVSMLTGMVPDVHGTYELERTIPREAPLLAEVFKNAGYHTFAMTSNFLVSPPYGFGRGFDQFLFRPEGEANEVNDGAIKLLGQVQEPWFGFVHYFDPHLPYSPTGVSRKEVGAVGPLAVKVSKEMTHLLFRFIDTYLPYNQEHKDMVRLLYDGEVRDVDRALGRLILNVRQNFGLKNTILVITADHGEEFFEHGWQGHSVSLHDESLRVPLIIVGKGVERGVVRQEITDMQILAPMVMDLAGLPDPLGRDWRALRGQDLAYGHTNAFGNPRYSYRNGKWAFLTEADFTYGERHLQWPPQLYDNAAEQDSLLGEQPEKASELKDEMDHYVGRQIKAFGQLESGSLELDKGRTQRLKELGYIN